SLLRRTSRYPLAGGRPGDRRQEALGTVRELRGVGGAAVKNRRKTPPEERFATKFVVDAATGCWLWTAYRNPQGYGQFSDGVRMVLAHRWAYEHWIGPVPGGLDLDHFACDNPACVNPEHVRPVTHRENMLRGNTPSAAQRARTHCVR